MCSPGPGPSRGLTRLPGSRGLGASGASPSRQVFQGDLAGNPKALCPGSSKLYRMAAHRSCGRQSVPPGWAQAEDQQPDPPRFLARSPRGWASGPVLQGERQALPTLPGPALPV